MTLTLTLDTSGPHSPQYTAKVGYALGEAVRVLNYATGPDVSTGLRYPSDVYGLLGSLYAATGRMPQLSGQLGDWLAEQARAGAIGVDGDDRPGAAVAAVDQARASLNRASVLAHQLTASLQQAQEAIAGMHARTGSEPEG